MNLTPRESRDFDLAKNYINEGRYNDAYYILETLTKNYPDDIELEKWFDRCQSNATIQGTNYSTRQTSQANPRNKIIFGVLGVVVLIIVGVLLLGNKSSVVQEDFTIEVKGAIPTVFSGTCIVVSSNGSSNSQDASGSVPATFKFQGNIVSCSFQKKAAGAGQLIATVSRGGQVINTGSTAQDYGVVLVASR